MAEHQTRHENHHKQFNPPGVQKHVTQDEILIQEVKDALMRGTESAGIDVQVAAENGHVRLHGVVDVLSHKRAAEETARRVVGVRTIENDIAIANEETASDKDLLEAVTHKLEHLGDTRDVGARVHRGVVQLVGHAASYDDVQKAVRLVEDMAGVKDVRVLRVKVGEGQKEDDADVSRAAERLLDTMGYNHRLFEVYCDAGVLFVKGFVPTKADRTAIKQSMHSIPGVDKLEATLIAEEGGVDEIH